MNWHLTTIKKIMNYELAFNHKKIMNYEL